jgi:3-methylcrotonyl-CoA carboxylase alpha subunit
VRVDTGVEQGDAITPHYDPMIAKLIVWDHSRDKALARMRQALAAYQVVGVSNNIEFLSRLVRTPAFATADLDTALIEREQALLFPDKPPVPVEVWLLATLAELQEEVRQARHAAAHAVDPDSPWRSLDGWRLNGSSQRTMLWGQGEHQQPVGVEPAAAGHRMSLGSELRMVRGVAGSNGQLQAEIGDRQLNATVVAQDERRIVFFEGRAWPLQLLPRLQAGGDAEEATGGLKAPMPGKVVSLIANAGDTVAKGAPLLVLEAMKMEHTITAPVDGRVKSFHFAAGDQVAEGVDLVDFEVSA